MWIAIERSSSRKILKVLDSLEYVVDNSADNIELPLEFSDLQNWLNLIKMQNREQQHLLEIEAQKKSDMLTYLAHDIRTPLASVVGYLSLLCEAPDMPAIQREKYTKVAFRKAIQFEKRIDDFFDITRYSLSDKTLVKREIDICFLIEQLADEFYPLLKPKELHIDLKLGHIFDKFYCSKEYGESEESGTGLGNCKGNCKNTHRNYATPFCAWEYRC